jgi:hypothetical protein
VRLLSHRSPYVQRAAPGRLSAASSTLARRRGTRPSARSARRSKGSTSARTPWSPGWKSRAGMAADGRTPPSPCGSGTTGRVTCRVSGSLPGTRRGRRPGWRGCLPAGWPPIPACTRDCEPPGRRCAVSSAGEPDLEPSRARRLALPEACVARPGRSGECRTAVVHVPGEVTCAWIAARVPAGRVSRPLPAGIRCARTDVAASIACGRDEPDYCGGNVAILLGAEFNAELERDRGRTAGVSWLDTIAGGR